jgi:hypothetical protein
VVFRLFDPLPSIIISSVKYLGNPFADHPYLQPSLFITGYFFNRNILDYYIGNSYRFEGFAILMGLRIYVP